MNSFTHKLNTAKIVLVNFFTKIGKTIFENILCILPVKKNRIVFSSFCGENFSCNPRAIYEFLSLKYKNKFEYVWLFDYNKNPIIPEELKQNAKCVQFNSLKSSYYKATSGIWCFNHRNTKYYHKKKNQLYIQTWHGDIGFKAIDKLKYTPEQCKTDLYALKCIKDSAMTDIVLTGSDWGYNNIRRAFFYEDGEIQNLGCPRNDALINHSRDYLYDEIREKYNIDYKTKICLYAPTFREVFDISEVLFNDDVDSIAKRIICGLEKRFGSDWVIFIKYHPACISKNRNYDFIDGKLKNFEIKKKIFDVSGYPDTADLLVGCDALISDYSSISFDFGLTGKPCWLYLNDFEDYVKHDRKMVINTDDIGFDMCYTKDELISTIENFDEDKYKRNINNMYKTFGSHEKGISTEKVAERILDFVKR